VKPKARFLKAARRQEPDRVPIFATLTPQVAQKLGEIMGLPSQPVDAFLSDRLSYTEILLALGNDAVAIGPGRDRSKPTKRLPNGHLIDEWGIQFREVGYYTEAVVRPLSEVESIADLNAYEFPEPLAPGRFEVAEKMVKKYGNDYAIIGILEVTMFELAWILVGLEKFLVDLLWQKPYVEALIDRILDFHITVGRKLIELGAEVILLGDDFGTQRGMLISPALYRQVFKPRQKKIIDALKAVNKEIIIAYHSCGSIMPIIEDLIEVGVEVLNPIQPQAAGMDLAFLKEKYGNQLAFFGGVDVQGVLPQGTPEEVKEEVESLK